MDHKNLLINLLGWHQKDTGEKRFQSEESPIWIIWCLFLSLPHTEILLIRPRRQLRAHRAYFPLRKKCEIGATRPKWQTALLFFASVHSIIIQWTGWKKTISSAANPKIITQLELIRFVFLLVAVVAAQPPQRQWLFLSKPDQSRPSCKYIIIFINSHSNLICICVCECKLVKIPIAMQTKLLHVHLLLLLLRQQENAKIAAALPRGINFSFGAHREQMVHCI